MNPLQKQKLNGLLLGSSCLVASVLLGLSPALAGSAARGLPSGGNVVSGNAKIGDHGSKITQTSEKAFIDWNNFSIGAGETVTIKGPNKNAVTVNRVTGVDRSVIDGVLRANDNVWLLNGNGILFGKGSIINVGSLIATTSDLSDDDFRKGKYRFTTGSNPNASVINKGKITAADGGTVILSAAHVANEGVVKANLGTVVLGGANAFTVDLNGDNLIRYQVTAQVTQAPTDSKGNAQKALVSNSGKIQADGGTVLMTSRAASNVQDNVINNSGMIEATSVSSHNGEVDLDAGTLDTRADGYRKSAGTVDDSGQIDVSGTAKGETGGTVTMTGRNVVLADGARVDAQGYAGGGTVLIGGDFHGRGPLKQAKNVIIGKATINADATHKGDGGKVALWSRGDTSFSGTVTARGGRDGGNGGYVETSGHELSIGDSARIKTLAANGNAGMWLIDPTSVEICHSNDCCGSSSTSFIDTSVITTGLNNGDVTIEAIGGSPSDITVADAVVDTSSTNTLSLLSTGSIEIDANIQVGGALNLVAGWNGVTGVSSGAATGSSNATVNMAAILSTAGAYGNSGGDITIGSAYSCGSVAVGSKGGTLTVDAEDVFVGPPNAGAKANDQLGYDGTGGGNITVNLLGDLTVESANGGTSQIGNGDASKENTGATAITGDIALNVAGTTTIAAEGNNTAWIGNVAYTGGTEAGDVTLVTGVLDVTNCGTASSTLLGSMMNADLGTSSSTGGNFTLGFTDTTGSSITGVNGDATVSDYFSDGLSYDSPHTLSLFSENDLVLGASIQNSGSGAINLVAGWNGASTSMATILANDDYGASGGDITLGDANSGDSVAVGSKSGTLTVAAADLYVGPPNGCQTANFQVGYLGAGGGDIDIVLTGDLDIQSDHGGTSRVGNGGTYYNGAVTGNITINAANINMNQNNAYGGGEAVIGNYGAGAVGGIIGITTSGDVLMSSKNGGGTQVSIGNGSYGDVSTTGNVTLNIGGNLSMYATGYATGHGGHDGGTYIGSKSATSNIKVTVAQNITMTVVPLHSYATHNYVQIGNFGSSASDSQAGGNITVTSTQGNIVMRERSYGGVQIGNTYAHTVSGNIVVTARQGDIDMYSNHGATQIGNSAYREQVSGNVTVKATQGNIGLYSLGQNAIVEIGNGPAVQTSGDITVTAGGAINLQAEYDYATVRIGNNGYGGATSGNIKVTAGGSITLYSNGEFGAGVVAQIGNGGGHMEGKASGNIVVSGGSLSIGSNSVTAYAMIGNGDPLHESKYSSGAYGNISINVTGATVLNGYGDTSAWIGNLADGGSTETGAVTLVTNSLSVETAGNADNTTLGNMVASDLTGSYTTATSTQGGTGGGNVTIAITRDGVTTDWGTYFGDGLDVSNGNTLSLVTKASMAITTSIQNNEGGNVDLIAGWDGTTGLSASGFHAATVIAYGAYGASGGDITIGGPDAGGDVAVGTLFGNTTVAGANVTLSGENGYAQIGYNGANSTGNITVDSTGSVTLSSDTAFTQIGNGGAGTNGNNGGNIVVDATGAIVLDFAIGENDAYAQIGNGGLDTNDQAGAAGSNSGNITVTGASVTLTAGGGNNDYAQIGNGGANSNDAAGSNNSGNIKVTTTSGDVTLTGGSQGGSDEQNDYAQIGMGGPFSGASNTKDTGNITVNSAAGITLTGGTDADQQNGFAVIGDTGTAKKTGDITVTAGGDITVRGGSATGNPNFTGAANSFAQIGDTNSGAITGNLTVTAGGSLTIRGGNGDAGDTAWVGNTSSDSNVIGNVSIAVDGTTIIDSYQSADQAGFGNTASGATATGTTLLNTDDLALGSDTYADFGKSLASSLDNGNVTVEIEDENADTAIAGAVFYDSANTLKILDRGSLHFESNIQNSGNGAIYVVGGWDGTTTNASNFTNAGVYGNNGGSITVGDVVGNVSIGSKSGTTTFAADNIDVDAETGIAQIGWSGIGGGNISVVANGNVTVETVANAECSDCTALIGNGGTGVDGTVTGNISVVTTGGSVSVSALGGYSYDDGNVNANSIATIGNLGDQASMRGNVAIDTNGGDVALVSSGTNSYAQIGSWSTEFGDSGSITSNITVDAGAVSLTANGSGSSADIGNGNYLGKSVNGAITGNITINATTLSVVADSSNTDYEEARVGNLGGGVVTGTLDVTTTGNVLVSGSGPGAASIGNFSSEYDNDIGGYDQGEATGTVEVTSGGSITVESNDGYASIELGGAKSGTVDVTAKKNITETATNGGGVLIGSLAIDNGGVNVSVTSRTGNIDLESSGANSTTQIGTLQDSQDVGGDTSGNVSVTATQGNITVAANNGGATQLGNIGDTDTGDTVSGNLTLTAGDVFDIATTGTTIGNTGGLESGNVAIKAATLQGDISPSIENDLPGGNFNLVLTGDDTLTLSSNIDYNSAHNLTLSNGGDIVFDASVQNSGSGNITVDSGDTVTIGGSGATGDVSVGSADGTTKVIAGNLVIDGENGEAALGDVDQNGNVIVTAGSVSASGHAEIVDHTADITVDAGNFGSASHPVELLVDALALNSAGGSAYITAPDSISIGVGSDGIDLEGGDLVLSSNGTITQTQAIAASSIDISGASIALTNAGNSFGDATLSSSGNAKLQDTSDLTIDSADVGGALTLSGSGNIGQSGAITADSLTVTSDGAIALTNAANSFGDATLAASGNASLYDTSDLTIDGTDVGGTLTLAGGGNIGQSGAIAASALDVTANHGTITLTNTGNAFANADLTASGNASLYDASDLKITGADVGGTLTLTGGGNIGQSGAITASTLDVTANHGKITLTDTGNAFADADLIASGNAALYDAADLTIDGADVGGTLTLTGGGNIGQSGAITASTLDVTANHGTITLTNTGNAFADADLTASGNASLYDAADLTVDGANVGGMLTLTGGGNIGQSGAIAADALKVTASNGSVTLANTGNSFGDATLTASGSASLYDAADLTIDGANVGGALTLTDSGNIGQSGAIAAGSLNVTAIDGAIALTNTANSFADATLTASGNAALDDSADLTIDGANVGGTLTLTGAKSIGQSGAIVASTLDVVANHGAIALTNTGNSIGVADLTSSGNASLYDAADLTIDGANVGGKLTLSGGGNIGQSGAIDVGALSVTAKHGSIALTDADNDVTTASLSAHGDVALYDSVDLTVKSAGAGGNLTLLTQGNLTFVSSVQLQNGDLLAVAGWDGTTTSPSALATQGAYGNNGGSITVGGKNAAGDVAIGSAKGSTTLAAANVILDGANGYAQIGYHGAGSGDIDVVASRDVTLTGGTGAGDYAQIGNGGMGTSGDESGNITVDAVGAVALDGGDGKDAYAQIGHGGADADKNSHGYTNSGTIDVKGQTVALLAGAGDESYAQIGHGGFDLGDGLTGQGVNSGNITITAVDGVSLTGNGTDAYTQIGNGGDRVNANAASSAGGSNSGDIVVAAGAGISMIAGASDDAYAQIGNGGFGTNASGDADPSNFTDSGTISVSDLVLTGSDTGKDAYAQIGNGDASGTGIGDVSGNITIDAGSITVHSGSATGANAAIANATGKGTVSGTVAGYTAPSTNNNSTQGVVTSIVSQTSQANVQQVSLIVVNPPQNQQTSIISDTGTSEETGPLGRLSGDKEGSGNEASDDATDALGQSLGGHRHNVQTVALIPGVLTEVVDTQTAHGIPPADQNFSSWGNEALWRW